MTRSAPSSGDQWPKVDPLVWHRPKAGDRLECSEGRYCCSQVWNGVDSLEEGDGRHALTVLSEPDPPPPPKCNGCGSEVTARSCTACAAPIIARALFDTDRRVLDFVGQVGDFFWYRAGVPEWDYDTDRHSAAMQRAWDLDEHGWRTEANERARDMLTCIRQASPFTRKDTEEPK